jgi:hypothetical protein
MIYETVEQENGQIIKATDEQGNIFWIPMSLGNADYQRYLEQQANANKL